MSWRDATTTHAEVCKEEQQGQTPAWTCQRVRSGLIQQVRVGVGHIFNIHAASQWRYSG